MGSGDKLSSFVFDTENRAGSITGDFFRGTAFHAVYQPLYPWLLMMIRSHASFLAALMTSETTSPFLTSSSQGISFWKLSQNCFNFVHAPIFCPSADSDAISWSSSESKLSCTQMSLIVALLSWARRIPYLMEIRLWSEQSVGIRMSFNLEINAFKLHS